MYDYYIFSRFLCRVFLFFTIVLKYILQIDFKDLHFSCPVVAILLLMYFKIGIEKYVFMWAEICIGIKQNNKKGSLANKY